MDHSEDSGAPGGTHAEPPLGLTPEELSAATVFAGLAVQLYDSHGIEETIDAVVAFALHALGCSHAGVAIAGRGRQAEVPAVTDPVVAGIYREQLIHGDGPMTFCMNERVPVLIADTAMDDRWPQWAAQVRALGVRSVLDVPLNTAEGPVGVLGLYNDKPGAFSSDDQAVAHILAQHATVAVANARHDATLRQAVDARKLVGQAMGILMERFDLDADRAFEVLKRYSQDRNLKLRDVAKTLVETRRLPDHRPATQPAP
jgi:GAF domain-containing protein